jgi:hypothetical protein
MSAKPVLPSVNSKSFSCPRCGAHADQTWFYTFANPVEDNELPLVVDQRHIQHVEGLIAKESNPGLRDSHQQWLKDLKRLMQGDVALSSRHDSKSASFDIENVYISKCYSCGQSTLWRYNKIIYPDWKFHVEPNEDMPSVVRDTFEEASRIVDASPRGAAALLRLALQMLCAEIGMPGKNINDDIKSLVADGLPVRIQQALDIVRVVGNEAVHPGTMDIRDNRDVAMTLFGLVNAIVQDRITQPKEIQSLYDKLPADKVAAIEKRDGKSP